MGEVEAFAKLEGPELVAYMKDLKVTLGRKAETKGCIHIGDHKKISKEHAEIFWNAEKQKFQIRCLSKNSIRVNRKKLDMNAPAVDLDTKTPIRIAQTCFYFLLPSESLPCPQVPKINSEN